MAGRLQAFFASGHHRFWADEISLRDTRRFRLPSVAWRQLIDVYLLGLATHNGGRLATFDRGIPRESVVGATGDHLVIIGI